MSAEPYYGCLYREWRVFRGFVSRSLDRCACWTIRTKDFYMPGIRGAFDWIFMQFYYSNARQGVVKLKAFRWCSVFRSQAATNYCMRNEKLQPSHLFRNQGVGKYRWRCFEFDPRDAAIVAPQALNLSTMSTATAKFGDKFDDCCWHA